MDGGTLIKRDGNIFAINPGGVVKPLPGQKMAELFNSIMAIPKAAKQYYGQVLPILSGKHTVIR